MTDQRLFYITAFEFRRFFSLKGEVLSMVLLVAIAALRFGGEKLIEVTNGVHSVAVEVAANEKSLVSAWQSKQNQYRFVETSMEERQENLQKLRDGALAAVLVVARDQNAKGAVTLYVRRESGISDDIVTAFSELRTELMRRRLGLSVEAADTMVKPPDVKVVAMERDKSGLGRQFSSLVIGLLVMVTLGIMASLSVVLQGITSEKFGKISEMVLAAIPQQLWLDGKVIAAMLIGIKTTIFYSAYALIAAVVLGVVDPSVFHALWAKSLDLAIIIFISLLGFMLWACIFTIVAVLIDSPETPLKNVVVLMPMACLLTVLSGVKNPDNPALVAMSFFPLTSPFAMPIRILAESISLPSVILGSAIILASCVAMRYIAACTFNRAILSGVAGSSSRKIKAAVNGGDFLLWLRPMFSGDKRRRE